MDVNQIEALRSIRLGQRQRTLLSEALVLGWAPITGADASWRDRNAYHAARRLEQRGLVQIELRVVGRGRARAGVALTDLGRAFARRFIRSIVLGGPVRTRGFRRELLRAFEARVAKAPQARIELI